MQKASFFSTIIYILAFMPFLAMGQNVSSTLPAYISTLSKDLVTSTSTTYQINNMNKENRRITICNTIASNPTRSTYNATTSLTIQRFCPNFKNSILEPNQSLDKLGYICPPNYAGQNLCTPACSDANGNGCDIAYLIHTSTKLALNERTTIAQSQLYTSSLQFSFPLCDATNCLYPETNKYLDGIYKKVQKDTSTTTKVLEKIPTKNYTQTIHRIYNELFWQTVLASLYATTIGSSYPIEQNSLTQSSQALSLATANSVKYLNLFASSFPVHIRLHMYYENLVTNRFARSKLYTPLHQLHFKLLNVQKK